MKRFIPVSMVCACALAALLLLASEWLGCTEYVAFSSPTCRHFNDLLGMDLYWVSTSLAMLLFPFGILIAPLIFWLLRQAIRAIFHRRSSSSAPHFAEDDSDA